MTTETDPALTFGGTSDPRYLAPLGSPEREALAQEQIAQLRAQIAAEGDWLVPGWTLGPGAPDTTASALLDRLADVQAEEARVDAMVDRLLNREDGP